MSKIVKIPVNIPAVPKNAKKYVNAVIDKNWVSSLCLDEEVNYIRKLEEGFSSFLGVNYAISVTSGSTALDLAIATLEIGSADEVIVPCTTIISTANAVIHNRATPVFVDVDPYTWCINPDLIESAITKNTKAIIVVHLYGYPCDMQRISGIAQKYNLSIIEDSAEAIGTRYNGELAGSIGNIGIFSFYANKTITSGEGGMLVTNDVTLAKKARMLKNQAFGETRFIHDHIGFNFRMNNLTAAYAYSSLEEVQFNISKKIRNAQLYNNLLGDINGITLPPESKGSSINSYWMYGILINEKEFGINRDRLTTILKSEYGIETRNFFYPMHKQPIMLKLSFAKKIDRNVTSEMLWERGIYLPSSILLTEEEIFYVADAIRRININYSGVNV